MSTPYQFGPGVPLSVIGAINGMNARLDILGSMLIPDSDETIGANLSAVLVRSCTLTSGRKVALGAGARLRIL